MATPPMKRREAFGYHFYRSNYITFVWTWFMVLASKAAEPVLFITTMYQIARLLPGLNSPSAAGVDNVLFIVQQVGLDVGGAGLWKLGQQARSDGNEAGAKLATRVGTGLVSIMIASVVLSVIAKFLGQVPLVMTIITIAEAVLVIARTVMAVVYGQIMHRLRKDSDTVDAHAATRQSSELERLQAEITTLRKQLDATPRKAQSDTIVTQPGTPADQRQGVVEENATVSRQHIDTSDKLALTLHYLAAHPEIATSQDGDEQLAVHLGLQRPASARFWKLKALEMLQPQDNSAHQHKDHGETLRVIHGGTASTGESDSKSRIVAYALAHPSATRQEIATVLGLSLRTVQRHLKNNVTTDDNEQSEQDQAQA